MSNSWSVAILCYNEAGTISQVSDEVVQTLQKLRATEFEIIIVDDNSNDDSQEIIKELAKKHNFIKPIFHSSNKGIGGATKSVYEVAQYENIYVISGDGESDVNEIILFNSIQLKDNEFVLFQRKRKQGYNLFRYFLTTFNKLLNYFLFRIWVDDINWNKVVKKHQIDKIDLFMDSVLIDSEIALKLIKKGFKLKVVETNSFKRKLGKSNGGSLKSVILSLKEISKLWISLKKQN